MKETIVHTKHIEIEKRENKKTIYFVVWYKNDLGMIRGFNRFHTADDAFASAVAYITGRYAKCR